MSQYLELQTVLGRMAVKKNEAYRTVCRIWEYFQEELLKTWNTLGKFVD